MRFRTIWAAVMIVLVGWGSASALAAEAQQENARAALERRQAEFADAMAARDAGRVVGFFSEAALLHIANQPAVQGREAIERFYQQVFRFLAATDFVAEALHLSASEDLAYVTARVTNAFERDGVRTEHAGKSVLVWERRDGPWQVALYTVSNNRADAQRR